MRDLQIRDAPVRYAKNSMDLGRHFKYPTPRCQPIRTPIAPFVALRDRAAFAATVHPKAQQEGQLVRISKHRLMSHPDRSGIPAKSEWLRSTDTFNVQNSPDYD
jgi:hypothetical protein